MTARPRFRFQVSGFSVPCAAFTLIEMLVVITIIIILAALTLPIVTSVMEKGRRTTCRSNVQQIGLAMFQYADDHKGWLVLKSDAPVYDSGGNLSGEYPIRNHVLKLFSNRYVTVTSMWICPSDRKDGVGGTVAVWDPKTFTGTGTNSWRPSGNCSFMYVAGYNNANTVETTSKAPVLADEANALENGTATPGNMPDIGPDDNHGANYRNVLFLDGHVVGLQGNDVANSIFDNLKYPNVLQSVD